MDVIAIVPVPELATADELCAELETVAFDDACTYKTHHDPFHSLVLAADRATTPPLGTAFAFARTLMFLATFGADL